MSEHVIAGADEIREGERIVVQVEGREVGVFNVDGEYYAYVNWCAHQGGPCCEGNLTGTIHGAFDRQTLSTSLEWSEEEDVLNCPWHGWEYEIETGVCLSRDGIRLPAYEVEVRDDDLVLHL